MIPDMDTEGWDYEPYEEGGGVPWITDFTVYGLTTGPACATEPVEEPARFPGTAQGGRPGGTLEQLNWLLSYSAPLRDRLHLPAGTTSYPMTIHYAAEIDPASFKVEPPHLRALFHPRPGGSEQVVLPLERPKTKLILEARPSTVPPGTTAQGAKKGVAPTPAAEAARGEGLALGQTLGDRKDRDVFEFRVDSSTPKSRKQQ